MNVVLLDRDGTVIRDPEDERVDREDKIELFPDSIEALQYLAAHDYAVILITNQAGIAEGRISVEDFERINAKVLEALSPSGVTILKTYMCPHDSGDGCACRKPKPKMVLDAIEEFHLDSEDLYMVGDRESDVMAGLNAGIKGILVETANIPVAAPGATYTAPTLLDAVTYIVSSTPQQNMA